MPKQKASTVTNPIIKKVQNGKSGSIFCIGMMIIENNNNITIVNTMEDRIVTILINGGILFLSM